MADFKSRTMQQTIRIGCGSRVFGPSPIKYAYLLCCSMDDSSCKAYRNDLSLVDIVELSSNKYFKDSKCFKFRKISFNFVKLEILSTNF